MRVPGSHINKEGMGVLDSELQWLYDQAKDMSSIIEVGSYKGRSTFALCFGCRGTVYSVDNFQDGGYEEYLNNVGFMPNLVTLKKSSETAAKELKDIKVDMVFIDAGHDEPSVKRDIQLWAPKALKLICGHDYNASNYYKGLRDVVDAYYPEKQLVESIWFYHTKRKK